MKLRFYLDLYPGSVPSGSYYASTLPNSFKSPGVKRIAFDVVVPDDVLGVDFVAPTSRPVEVGSE